MLTCSPNEVSLSHDLRHKSAQGLPLCADQKVLNYRVQESPFWAGAWSFQSGVDMGLEGTECFVLFVVSPQMVSFLMPMFSSNNLRSRPVIRCTEMCVSINVHQEPLKPSQLYRTSNFSALPWMSDQTVRVATHIEEIPVSTVSSNVHGHTTCKDLGHHCTQNQSDPQNEAKKYATANVRPCEDWKIHIDDSISSLFLLLAQS